MSLLSHSELSVRYENYISWFVTTVRLSRLPVSTKEKLLHYLKIVGNILQYLKMHAHSGKK